jgi:hypothetical protein
MPRPVWATKVRQILLFRPSHEESRKLTVHWPTISCSLLLGFCSLQVGGWRILDDDNSVLPLRQTIQQIHSLRLLSKTRNIPLCNKHSLTLSSAIPLNPRFWYRVIFQETKRNPVINLDDSWTGRRRDFILRGTKMWFLIMNVFSDRSKRREVEVDEITVDHESVFWDWWWHWTVDSCAR